MGKCNGVAERFRQVGVELLHFLRGAEIAFGVAGEQASGRRESFVMADGGESIAKFVSFRNGVVHAIRSKQRKVQRAGEFDGNAVAEFFLTLKVALSFD